MGGMPLDAQVKFMLDELPPSFWDAKNRDPREDLHAWFGYPAMMVPAHPHRLIAEMCRLDTKISSVLDPFAGAGTTMTAAMQAGLSYCGQDINPLAVLVCKAKQNLCPSAELKTALNHISNRVESDSSDAIEARFSSIDKWFSPVSQVHLSKLRRSIRAEANPAVRQFFWVVLAETIRMTSRSRTSTYKLHIRPEDEWARLKPPIPIFDNLATRAIADADVFRSSLIGSGRVQNGAYSGSLDILLADSVQGIAHLFQGESGYDLVVTSPPYGDNVTTVPYGQQAYLPLQWIDGADIDSELDIASMLSTTQMIDRQSLGGAGPADMEEEIARLSASSKSFAQTARRLRTLPADRLRRVARFVRDLDSTLPHIVNSLRPDAYAIWFVGNRHVGGQEIPTRDILVQLAEKRGFVPIHALKRTLWFRRMATHNRIASMMRTEHILVFRKGLA